jgi:hypothetical protein
VHGACGSNAALTALHDAGWAGSLARPVRRAARKAFFPQKPDAVGSAVSAGAPGERLKAP